MANKFQKSVLERLEQEAVRQKQENKAKIKVGKKEPEEKAIEKLTYKSEVKATENAVTSVKPQAAPKTEVTPEMSEPEQTANKNELSTLPDISEYLRRDNQRLAKNKTFYLDSDVIDAIKTTAKAQSVTDSKLVNDILRRVLGLW